MQAIATKLYNKSVSTLSRYLSRVAGGSCQLSGGKLRKRPQMLALNPERFDKHMDIFATIFLALQRTYSCREWGSRNGLW